MNRRYALVTGAGRGIGRAVACRLARAGYTVLINYLQNETAAAETLRLIEEAGGEAELMRFDVADRAAVDEALAAWHTAHPEAYISVLVNNAGIRRDNLLMWMPREDWHAVLHT